MKLRDMLNLGYNESKEKVEIKEVPIDKLDSMLDYQRDIDMKFVEEKSRDDVFDEDEVSIVLVSVRPDGSMKVCDGQHTVAILKRRGYTMVRCKLRYGLTKEKENDWFYTENTKRRGQASKRTLTASVNGTYEKHKYEQDFNSCIKSLGFKLDIFGEEPGNLYKIGCPTRLLEIYKNYVKLQKADDFIECLDLIKTCFKGDPHSLQWNFLRGSFDFYEAYKNDFDRKRFITVMSKHTPKSISSKIETDMYTKKPSLRYARFFVNEYNTNLNKNKKLKMSKLED